MMTIVHLLEDFGAKDVTHTISLTEVSLEEKRLDAFENGYQAGWDDSIKAQAKDTQRVSSDLAQNLTELSLTHEEAHAGVIGALKPLIEQVVMTVLPQVAHQTIGIRLSEVLNDMVAQIGKQNLEVVVSPANFDALENIIAEHDAMSLSIVQEPSLGEGQVYVRVGQTEREINMSGVLSEIDRLVSDFIKENQKEAA